MSASAPQSVADLLKETVVEFRDAKRKLPGAPLQKTLVRWSQDGLSDGRGGRIFLEAFKLGPRPATTMEAYARFCKKLTERSQYGRKR